MIFQILDDKEKVVNTIIAEQDFVEKEYKGKYKDVTPPVESVEPVAPVKTLEQKVDELTAAVAALAEKK